MATLNKLRDEVLALPPGERAELMDALSESLSQVDEIWAKEWASECERRLDEFEAGGAGGISETEFRNHFRIA